MTLFRVVTEIEADNLAQAWAKSSQGHPRNFATGGNWTGFKSFRIEEVFRSFELNLEEKENN